MSWSVHIPGCNPKLDGIIARRFVARHDNLHTQEKVYKPVRQPQLLDKVATEAGLLLRKAITLKAGERKDG